MDLLTALGIWFGFLLSLMTFSLIIRDNLFERLAQYVLVGAATGYLMVLVIQNILRPKLVDPILATDGVTLDLLPPLFLGIALLYATVSYTLRQGRQEQSLPGIANRETDSKEPDSREPHSSEDAPGEIRFSIPSLLNRIGQLALLLIVSVGLSNTVIGSLQGNATSSVLAGNPFGSAILTRVDVYGRHPFCSTYHDWRDFAFVCGTT